MILLSLDYHAADLFRRLLVHALSTSIHMQRFSHLQMFTRYDGPLNYAFGSEGVFVPFFSPFCESYF